jgi:hypothetical protein
MANLSPVTRRAVEAAERMIREREARGGYTAQFAEWYDDPIGFNEKVLGRTLWDKQADVCRSVVECPVTVVPAGRAVGKSFLLSGLVLWWLYTRERSLVVTTGPDHRQVVSVLFKELRRAIRPHRDEDGRQWPSIPLGYAHLTQGYASPQRLELVPGNEWCAIGFAAGTQEGFSGQHQAEMLVLVDEASGIAEPIWQAIDGLLPKRLVVSGNPIKYDCRFRELHDLALSGSANVRTVPISCLEHPHAAMETSPVGAVCASFLRQMRELHGEFSPWWSSNVLGLFPGQESVRFLPAAWLDRCTDPAILDDPTWQDMAPGRPKMGVDVGGGVGADKSVCVVRDDRQLLEVFASEWHGVLDDARYRLEPIVLAMARKWNVQPQDVIYDKGGPGRSFGSYLARYAEDVIAAWWREHPHGPMREAPEPFEGVIGSFGGGSGGRLYVNRRTANAYAVKRRLDPNRKGHVPFYCGNIPQWPLLRQELLELKDGEMETVEGAVRQALETKESLMSRLKRSPDFLDAFSSTFTYVD